MKFNRKILVCAIVLVSLCSVLLVVNLVMSNMDGPKLVYHDSYEEMEDDLDAYLSYLNKKYNDTSKAMLYSMGQGDWFGTPENLQKLKIECYIKLLYAKNHSVYKDVYFDNGDIVVVFHQQDKTKRLSWNYLTDWY